MKRRIVSLGLIFALMSMVTLAPMAATASTAEPAVAAAGLVIPIITSTDTFAGTFTLTPFILAD